MTIKNDLLTIKQGLNLDEYNLKELCDDDRIRLIADFHMFIDGLQRDNMISQKTARNVYLSKNRRNEIVMKCLSYTMRIS